MQSKFISLYSAPGLLAATGPFSEAVGDMSHQLVILILLTYTYLCKGGLIHFNEI